MSRRIDRLLIDQHGVDHAAHLDQLLPVSAVAGKARHLARADGTDLAEADFGNHAFEAHSGHCARCGSAEILIDTFDVAPAEVAQSIPHGILHLLTL